MNSRTISTSADVADMSRPSVSVYSRQLLLLLLLLFQWVRMASTQDVISSPPASEAFQNMVAVSPLPSTQPTSSHVPTLQPADQTLHPTSLAPTLQPTPNSTSQNLTFMPSLTPSLSPSLSMMPTERPTLYNASSIKTKFEQRYIGGDYMLEMNQTQSAKFELFIENYTKAYGVHGGRPYVRTNCTVIGQIYDELRRRRMQIPDEKFLSDIMNQSISDKVVELKVIFQMKWSSDFYKLNLTNYTEDFLGYMNSQVGRRHTMENLYRIGVYAEKIGVVRPYVPTPAPTMPPTKPKEVVTAADEPTWSAIVTTCIFTGCIMVVCFVIFEFSRRQPAVANVFDRRRVSKPHNTPSPLLKSRYFEWMFLKTDPAYMTFAEKAYKREKAKKKKAKLKKKKQQQAKQTPFSVPRPSHGLVEVSERSGEVDILTDEEKHSMCSLKDSVNDLTALDVTAASQIATDDGTETDITSSPQPIPSQHLEGSFYSNADDLDGCNLTSERGIYQSLSNGSQESSIRQRRKRLKDLPQASFRTKSSLSASYLNRQAPSDITMEESTVFDSKCSSTPRSQLSQLQFSASDIVELNDRLLPAEIAEMAISGQMPEDQLDAYELLVIEKLEQEDEMDRAEGNSDGEGKHLKEYIQSLCYNATVNVYNTCFRSSPRRLPPSSPSSLSPITEEEPVKAYRARGIRRKRLMKNAHRQNQSYHHLTSTVAWQSTPLSIADNELLRYVGLDVFVMLRFLRFGFDVTFYPFIVACLVLIPTYYTNPFNGEIGSEEVDDLVVHGYYRITMNRLEIGSPRLWVCFLYALGYRFFLLYRFYQEWRMFIAPRFDFLAHGDSEMNVSSVELNKIGKKRAVLTRCVSSSDDDNKHLLLEQYRNSCLVEYIPPSYSTNQQIFDFFNEVFPGKVKRAELLLRTADLNNLIKKRQKCIEAYEDLYALQFHKRAVYRKRLEKQNAKDVSVLRYICCWCSGLPPIKPRDPTVWVPGNGSRRTLFQKKKKVEAIPHYFSQINKLNRQIEKEHRRLMEHSPSIPDDDQGMLLASVAAVSRAVAGTETGVTSSTGFVEFDSVTSVQIAIQCNITGTSKYMSVQNAPDPRAIAWENSTVAKSIIKMRTLQCNALLSLGVIFWSPVVAFVSNIADVDRWAGVLPDWLIPKPGTVMHGFVQGYLPVFLLEALMMFVPPILRAIAHSVIRFKTESDIDHYVFKWHFAYRFANIFFVIVSGSLRELIMQLKVDPEYFMQMLTQGISFSSQFFLDNVIFALSQTTWELAQVPTMVTYFVTFQWITIEATSQRKLEKLEEAKKFEWGEFVPEFIFTFMVSVLYCTSTPLVIGAASVFFYLATKVYTHQALYVYSQPYESGGTLMYALSRTVFSVIHVSNLMFAILLGLKGAGFRGTAFFIITTIATYVVHKKINKEYVIPSTDLSLVNARVVDVQFKKAENRARQKRQYEKQGKKRSSTNVTEVSEVPEHITEVPPISKLFSAGDDEIGKPEDLQLNYSDDGDTRNNRRRQLLDQGTSFYFDNGDFFQDDYYAYRQPQMNKAMWETKPRPYR